ncbi:DUF4153 domain-containing protein [Nocardia ninae]|uniref:Uncharacterized protein n=1 Tax=Nocardia ninae NBRC 108245 TaxID=1210091 RepID=A0A511M517_9NOCA|nr:DUF4153 domain-containing protein [Nocardia ninae]GEM35719.1 hypothetical protein NN4_02380 [Nocardia ninae NBRC 108245]
MPDKPAAPIPSEADKSAASQPQTPAHDSPLGALLTADQPVPATPQPIPAYPEYQIRQVAQPPAKWRRVVCPPGVLPAACLAGFAGAVLIPLDRPGIGWLLAGSVGVGAVLMVDRNARKSGQGSADALDSVESGESGTEVDAAGLSQGVKATSPATASNPGGEDSTRGARAERSDARPDQIAEPGAPRASDGAKSQPDELRKSTAAVDATDSAAGVAGDGDAADARVAPKDASTSAAAGAAATSAVTAAEAVAGTADDTDAQVASLAATTAAASDATSDSGAGVTETADAASNLSAATPPVAAAGIDTDATADDTRVASLDATDSAAAEDATTREVQSAETESRTGQPDGLVGSTSRAMASSRIDGAKSEPADAAKPEGTQQESAIRRRLGEHGARNFWTGMLLALLAVGTFRAAGWLFTLCVLAACVAGSLAVVGRRSVHGVLYDVIAWPLASLSSVPWVYAGAKQMRGSKSRREQGVVLSVVVTVALLAVFIPLLGGADATFAKLLEPLTPEIATDRVFQKIVLFVVVGLAAVGALYVLAGPPQPATESGNEPVRTLRRLEWALPVSALTVLFAVFVGAQFVALFGGDDYVQRTAGLTYAEYARTGFWQLSLVTILTLAVILVVLRWAGQESAADRLWLRVLLSAVSVLSLVIVASALGRMWTYQQAYGFTLLRLLVEVCELWLGLVYLLVLAAVFSLRRTWLPRAVIGTAMATLLALAVLNPERLIADQNIDRWEHGKPLDTSYLSELSTDILPAIDRLPEPMRTQVRERVRAQLDADTWQSWNLSRSDAAR